MKNLVEYLEESLLDDLDDLLDISDKEVQHTAVDSPEFIEEYGGGWKVEKDTAVLNAHTYEGKKLNFTPRELIIQGIALKVIKDIR